VGAGGNLRKRPLLRLEESAPVGVEEEAKDGLCLKPTMTRVHHEN